MLDLFDKLIFPILNYGAEVWGFSDAKIIERVHLQFYKHLLGVRKQTQNDFIYGELGRVSLQQRRYITIIKYWFKLLKCTLKSYTCIIECSLTLKMLLVKNHWQKNGKNL